MTELPSVFVGEFFINRYGRRWCHVVCMVVTTGVNFTNILRPTFLYDIYIICTGGPRYSRNFNLRVRSFKFKKWPKITISVKIGLFICSSRFGDQDSGAYLPRITRSFAVLTSLLCISTNFINKLVLKCW